jgi:hypothetical protein
LSFRLEDLQGIAEARAREYMVDKHYYCSMATLLAVNDALKDVDDVNYADPTLIKAIGPLAGGMGAWEAPCGAVAAGSAAIGLKYGASDPSDARALLVADPVPTPRRGMLTLSCQGKWLAVTDRATPMTPPSFTRSMRERNERKERRRFGFSS